MEAGNILPSWATTAGDLMPMKPMKPMKPMNVSGHFRRFQDNFEHFWTSLDTFGHVSNKSGQIQTILDKVKLSDNGLIDVKINIA